MSHAVGSYWISGYAISRPVLQSNIKYYLGPEAFVRPFTHQGRDGFLVTAPGGRALTRRQLESICEESRAWEARASQLMCGNEYDYFINTPIPIVGRDRTWR